MFSKETYSKNRKSGRRGQGEYPDLVGGQADIEHNFEYPGTRKQRRKSDSSGKVHLRGRRRRGGKR